MIRGFSLGTSRPNHCITARQVVGQPVVPQSGTRISSKKRCSSSFTWQLHDVSQRVVWNSWWCFLKKKHPQPLVFLSQTACSLFYQVSFPILAPSLVKSLKCSWWNIPVTNQSSSKPSFLFKSTKIQHDSHQTSYKTALLTWCLFPSNPTRRPPNAASARIRTRPTPRTTPSAGSTQALRGRAGRAALRTATPSVGTSGGHGGTGGHGVARDATWNIWGQETTRCWKNISLVTEWFPPSYNLC